jgi:hypothetical protein
MLVGVGACPDSIFPHHLVLMFDGNRRVKEGENRVAN